MTPCSAEIMVSKNGRVIKTAQQAFDHHVIVRDVGCWGWKGFHNAAGYGVARFGGRGVKKILAHRLSWQLYRGEIPDGLHVLHHCDIPGCVNPNHLFLGTNLDNIKDRMKKGRPGGGNFKPGERHWKAKLSNEQVREIIARRANGEKAVTLSKEFHVRPEHISNICRKQSRREAWDFS